VKIVVSFLKNRVPTVISKQRIGSPEFNADSRCRHWNSKQVPAQHDYSMWRRDKTRRIWFNNYYSYKGEYETVFPQAAKCGGRKWDLRWRSAWQIQGTAGCSWGAVQTICKSTWRRIRILAVSYTRGAATTTGSLHASWTPAAVAASLSSSRCRSARLS